MEQVRIVIDTNVLIASLGSKRGASYKLLGLLGGKRFKTHLSVPLALEYEKVAKDRLENSLLTEQDIDDILDYICAVSRHVRIFYLWRPFLRDPQDDMVLELAVSAHCEYIVTYNTKDFRGAEGFGVQIVTPLEFLKIIGALS